MQDKQLAVVSMAAIALYLVLAWALATAREGATAQLWCAVGATSALVLAGWAASHAFAVPGLTAARGDWTALPGGIAALLAAISLAVALKAAAPRRDALRVLACAGVVVSLTLPPVAGAMGGRLAPGTIGGATVVASGGHLHSQGSPESSFVFQSIPGGKGGHFVLKAKAAPHRTPLGLAVLIGTAALFAGALVGSLRRRSTGAPAEPVTFHGVEARPA